MKVQRIAAAAAAVAAAVIIAGGIASASIPGADGTIRGCITNKTGALRVIDGGACKSTETPLNWNQTGPAGKDATLPAGTITGAVMSVGSLSPNDDPGNGERLLSCPGDRVAVAGLGWITLGPGTRQAPILVQIADGNRFRSTYEVDWSFYLDQVTPDTSVSWNVTCANVSP